MFSSMRRKRRFSSSASSKQKDQQENNNSEGSTAVASRVRRVIQIASWHVALYIGVLLYILMGAYAFFWFEGEHEDRTHEIHREMIASLKTQFVHQLTTTNKEDEINQHLLYFIRNLSKQHIPLEHYLIMETANKPLPKRWTYQSSILFSFTILTTIGYGDVVPKTHNGKIFTMVFGAIGIPLFLITIADLGSFSKTGIMTIVQLMYKKELKKQGEMKMLREIGEVLLVAAIFLIFIAAGSAILPLWEEDLSYFDSVYFSYMSLTTIGLGDIVPRRMDFLLPTLVYLTIGLWLTTALVEQLADVFRLVHYAGRKVKNVKGISVWLGGRRLSMGSLIQTVCRRVGMSDHLIGQINWDRTLDQALSGIMPPSVPIFPWHFADFVDHDPPLIDLSIDFDQATVSMDGNSYYPPHPASARKSRRTSQMSAPAYNPVNITQLDTNRFSQRSDDHGLRGRGQSRFP
ncbi:unnamed protein product, partial [Mesorhabditis belari]|uniref:Potassium channel domain-containing protein n=1 Tax=Mesorhabditis belari TaxID=2138241 RepID=A0AAF3ETF1_9BILA